MNKFSVGESERGHFRRWKVSCFYRKILRHLMDFQVALRFKDTKQSSVMGPVTGYGPYVCLPLVRTLQDAAHTDLYIYLRTKGSLHMW